MSQGELASSGEQLEPAAAEGENPAKYAVNSAVDSALEKFLFEVDGAVRGGQFSEQDVERALSGLPDFQDAWLNWVAESGD